MDNSRLLQIEINFFITKMHNWDCHGPNYGKGNCKNENNTDESEDNNILHYFKYIFKDYPI